MFPLYRFSLLTIGRYIPTKQRQEAMGPGNMGFIIEKPKEFPGSWLRELIKVTSVQQYLTADRPVESRRPEGFRRV